MSVVFSDHYPITFQISSKVRRKKISTCHFLNFKKANWKQLNIDLRSVEWDNVISRSTSDESWTSFKDCLNDKINKNIPRVKVKNEFQPPWFDAECYQACCEKEILRRKYKRTQSQSDSIKFSVARKEFKKLVKQKLNSNLSDINDSNLITKKTYNTTKYYLI